MSDDIAVASLGPAPRGATRHTVISGLRRQWRCVAVAALATLAGSVALALGPWIVRHGIDRGVRAGEMGVVRAAAVGYVVVLTVAGVASGVRTVAMAVAAERFVDRLRVDSLAGLLRLDLGIFERTRRGDLLARVTADTEALAGAARWVVPDVVRLSADLVAALVAVALLEPALALLALVAIPPMTAAARVLRRRSVVVYPRYRTEIGLLVGGMTETIEGAATVRAHGRRAHRIDGLRAANGRVTARYLDGTAMRNRFYASITLTRVTATAIVLVAASLLAVNGAITVGTAAAGVLAVTGVFGPLAWLTELVDDALSARSALDRVVAAAAIQEPTTGDATLPERGALAFESVSFAYRPGVSVLEDVTLTLPQGHRAAIVGETGAGKSTLARLAAGISRPTSGVVTFGGVDLSDVVVAERHRRLLFVPQEAFCLSGTIADNLRLAAPDADDERLHAAVGRLGLAQWLAGHADGLERDVGVRGGHLSAGEQQLVGLLRVALRDPAVVILDETTSALDAHTEALVGSALEAALEGRTVLVIAHRPETAARSPHRLLVADRAVRAVDVPQPAASPSRAMPPASRPTTSDH